MANYWKKALTLLAKRQTTMLKRFALILLLTLPTLVGKAQRNAFITPNFGATYTEQEQMIEEEMEQKKSKGEFHATVEAGVNASFGRNNPYRGGTFYTGVNGMYIRQINKKLMVAAGFDLYNYMGTVDATTLGVYAMAHYQFNDRMDGTIYVEHNFGNLRGNSMPFNPMMRTGLGYGIYGGGLLGMAGYTMFNPSTTVAGNLGWTTRRGGRIELGFSFTHMDNTNSPFTMRRHDYIGGMPCFY